MKALTSVVATLALVLIAFIGFSFYQDLRPVQFHGTAYDPPEMAPEFFLVEHTGRTLRLSDLRGRPVLVFFGYTRCPDVCPLTLTALRQALDELGAGPDDVRVAMITVDQVNDTMEALARYVANFGPGVSGLTGSPDALNALYGAYGVHATSLDGHQSEMVMHTPVVFGIDSTGKLRVLLHPTDLNSGLKDDLRTLLRL
ncbi:MAG: SCO family protein [Gemmatimonadetes bacterium]|nr:SCO family protein [Gemmatimonadota bacterium]